MRIAAISSSILMVLMFTAGLPGCSSDKKEAKDPDKWDMGKVDTEPQPSDYEPSSGDDDDDDESGDDDDEPAPKPKPKPKDEDYEINHRDCDALAGAYGRAWERDEMKKLNEKKLKKAAFDKQAAQLKEHAEGMKDNWRNECYGTVGTAYLRSRLKCAMKAKSMQRFNDCMDGLAE